MNHTESIVSDHIRGLLKRTASLQAMPVAVWRSNTACRWARLSFVFIMAIISVAGSVQCQTQSVALAPSYLKGLSLEALMNIEVTSVSKHPEKLLHAPSAIQVISSDDIRRSGASTIPEALQLATNLDVARGSSAGWNISSRGFNAAVGNKLLVLIDGRSVYTPLFSGVIWNMQDVLLADIDRIEVISGPGGTLWGANAVNGVINITTKNSAGTQGWYLEGGTGTALKGFSGIRYGGMLGATTHFRLYGKYFDQTASVDNGGNSLFDSWDRGQGGFRLDAEPTSTHRFSLQGDIYAGHTGVSSATNGEAGGSNLVGRWTHTISDNNELTVQAYFDHAHLTDPFAGSGNVPAGVLVDDLNTYDIDFQDRWRVAGSDQIVFGATSRFTHDVAIPAPVVAFIPGVLNQTLLSAFIQNELKAAENLTLTVGCKLEHNDYTGYEVEPNGRVQYNIEEKQSVWGAVSRAVRSPSRYDRDLYQPDPQYTYPYHLIGNSDFISETVFSYELGYRAGFGENISFTLSGFYNEYDHLRSLNFAVVPPSTLNIFFRNDDQAITRGLELSAVVQVLETWRLHGGYDVLKEAVHIREGGVDLYNALNETGDPEQQIFLRSSVNLPHNIEFDCAARGITPLNVNSGSNPGTVPGYFELNARLSCSVTNSVELSLVGQNLLHNNHPEYGFPGPGRTEIQRMVYGKVVLQF